MGTAVKIQQTPLGYEIELPHYTLLMGGVKAQFENIKASYPAVEFVRIKQIHGDGVVESENSVLDYQVIADAHYTRAANLGLCVVTADCMPVFLIHPASDTIAGIHAGWRGVANRIAPKTIAKLHALGTPHQDLHVIIGPHIHKNSFEVDYDVRDQILTSISWGDGDKQEYAKNQGNMKSLVDLSAIMKAQLIQEGIPADQIYDLQMDTFTDSNFHSHRRDKEKAGRQISFIYRHD